MTSDMTHDIAREFDSDGSPYYRCKACGKTARQYTELTREECVE